MIVKHEVRQLGSRYLDTNIPMYPKPLVLTWVQLFQGTWVLMQVTDYNPNLHQPK